MHSGRKISFGWSVLELEIVMVWMVCIWVASSKGQFLSRENCQQNKCATADAQTVVLCCGAYSACCRESKDLACPSVTGSHTCSMFGPLCRTDGDCSIGRKCCKSTSSAFRYSCCWSVPAATTTAPTTVAITTVSTGSATSSGSTATRSSATPGSTVSGSSTISGSTVSGSSTTSGSTVSGSSTTSVSSSTTSPGVTG